MAIVVANLLKTGSASSASTFATASVSLKAGRLYLLSVSNDAGAGNTANAATISAGPGTWAQVEFLNYSGNARRGTTMLRCMPTADASGALTIAFGGQTQPNGVNWILDGFTGAANGSNGANAIVQSVKDDYAGSAVTSFSLTLSAFGSSSNATYASIHTGAAATVTPKTGFTETGETAVANNTLEAEFLATSDTSPSWTLSTSTGVNGAIGVEIALFHAEAAAGTGTAYAPTVKIKPNAENAAGTGTAYDATVSFLTPPRTVTIGSTDYTEYVQQSQFSLTECANRGEVGTGGFDVIDTTSALTIPAMKAVTFDDPAAGSSNKRIFTGFTQDRTGQYIRDAALAARMWNVECVDLNVLASDFVLTDAEGADRSAETDYARVVWLLTTAFGSTASVGSGVVPNSNTVTMEATDYRDRKAADVLAECSEAAGKLWFVYDYGAGRKLYYDTAGGTSLSSTAYISDLPADTQVTTLDQLSAVGSWTNGANSNSTVSAVATNPTDYTGTSLQMAIAGEGSYSYIGNLNGTWDLSGYDADTPIRIYSYASTLTSLTSINLRFRSDATNFVEYDITPSSGSAFEEFTLTKSAPDTTVGTVDWSAIDRIAFTITPSASYTGNFIVRDLRIGGFDGIYAPQSVSVKKSPDRVYSKIYLTYQGGVVSAADTDISDAYRVREASVLDSSISDATLAQAKVDALLAGSGAEITEVDGLSLVLPATYVNDIRPGQRVQIKLTRHDIDSFTYFRVIRRTVQPLGGPDPDTNKGYYLVSLGLASDVLASANGSRGRDDIWQNMSNANEDGASAIWNKDGLTITDGAITVTNGSSVVIIDGTSNMFKIAASGTQNATRLPLAH